MKPALKTMNNPVLFIFLGKAINMLDPFMDLLDEYVLDGASFISMQEHPYDEWIKDEINRVHQEFIRRSFDSNGIIRVNYIMSADYWDLTALKETVNKYIAMLYHLEIHTDIYWLLDDASALDGRTPNRIRTMEMLDGGKLTDANIYLISNLDSNNVLLQEEDTLRTIVLLSLFKDYEPGYFPVAPDASRYNEYLFYENARASASQKRDAVFLTAGCRGLQMPQKELQGFFVNILLDLKPDKWQDTGNFDIDSIICADYTQFSKIVDREYVYGLTLPEIRSSDYIGLSRSAIIKRLFGKRLDGVLKIYVNESVDLSDKDLLIKAMDNLSFYQALDILGSGGAWRTAVENAIEENGRLLQAAQENFKKWLQDEHNIKSAGKRNLSFLVKVEDWPFVLAQKYLDKSSKVAALESFDKHLWQLLAKIDEYYTTLLDYLQTVRAAQDTLNWDTIALDTIFEQFVPNVSDYFYSVFKKYEDIHSGSLKTLTDPMIQHLREGTFVEYVSRLATFVENELLPSMNLRFTDLLTYLERECKGQLPLLLADWAKQGRHFSMSLKTGYVSLHTETGLFLPQSVDAASIKTNYETSGLGRMNLFVDKDAGRIDVLYHAGVFSINDLYYKDLYV